MERREQNQNADLTNFLTGINQTFKPQTPTNYTKLVDIPKNLKLTIQEMKFIETKYGKKLLVKLVYNQLGVETNYYVILPERYNKMSDSEIQIMSTNEQIKFIYKGKNSNNQHEIDFTT